MIGSIKKEDITSFYIPLAIALFNLAFFGFMFFLMNYFELIGSDPAYFDEGTIQNLKYINMVSGLFGIDVDPTKSHKISTLLYSLCLGFALISTFFAIVISNKKPVEGYEVTEAKQ
jgi:hypothetical protein